MTEDKIFWFIRHAESEGNVGLPTSSASDIPLTTRGTKQAECIASYLSTPPDLFVISPYSRTGETAGPTLKKFPDIPVETWPIEEFTYLPAELHRNTTTAQRNKPAIEYFNKSDPDLLLGEGAESFNQLIGRVDTALNRLAASSHNRVYLLSHGWFMRTLVWRLIFFDHFGSQNRMNEVRNRIPNSGLIYCLFSKFGGKIRGNEMTHFLIFSATIKIPNGSFLKLSYDQKTGKMKIQGVDDSHILPELRGKHLGNR